MPLVIAWRNSNVSKTKKNLVRIYTASTGTILIGTMVVVFLLNLSEHQKYSMERFLMIADSLTNQLQTSPMLNLSELGALEVKNKMIIYILDNGCPISFQGAFQSNTDRNILVQKVIDGARLEGVSADNPPSFINVKRSSIMKIKGNAGDEYYAIVINIPLSTTYRSVTLLYSLSSIYSSFRLYAFFYLLITIIGILLLFFISYRFIGKTLIPLKESNEKQVEFIASASHELRSPLAYIQTSTGALKTDCLPYMAAPGKEALLNYIKNANEEFQRMSALIEDMLLLASANNKTWSIHIVPTNGDTFFIESYEPLSRVCFLHNHELCLDLPEEFLGEIYIDSNRVYQMLQILINNANCYTPDGSEIIISPRRIKNQLVIDVIDHGKGIPDSEKERVFDRYYRRDSSRTDKSHFGLGLNIARELAHLHHGELTLFNTLGGGCTFQIVLPFK